ncbi:MAG: ArsR family transcriptional regulator [Candidatus Thermoplasmatota archaeon]
MTRHAVGALVVLALFLPLAPQAAAQAGASLVINVHTATPQGCGDYGWGPHYSYRVFVDGAQVTASDTRDPVNGVVTWDGLVQVDLGTHRSVALSFEVVDHAMSFFSSTETACNLTTSGSRLTVQYVVGSAQLVRGGSTNEGAAIEAYVSDSTLPVPTIPTIALRGAPDATSANVSYATLNVPGFTRADLVDASRPAVTAASTTSAAAGVVAWSGLDENTAYDAQLRAYGGSWVLASNTVSFTTANLPPPAPELSLMWQNGTAASFTYHNAPRDLASLTVFLSREASFRPGATPDLTLNAPFATFVDLFNLTPNATYYLIARSRDTGNLSTEAHAMSFSTTAPQPPYTPRPTYEQAPTHETTATPTPPWPTYAQPTTIPHRTTSAELAASFQMLIDGDGGSPDAPINVSIGGSATVHAKFLDHAAFSFSASQGIIETTHYDANLGATVTTSGYAATLIPSRIDVGANQAVDAMVRIAAPDSASRGDLVTITMDIFVTGGGTSALVKSAPIYARISSAAPPVDVKADANVRLSTTQVALVAGVATVGITLVAAALLRRDATRFALAAALYTRTTRGQTLDHPARESLHKRIASEPGVCYTDLKRDTGLTTGVLVHHLRALERAGYLSSRKEGAFRRFYAAGSAPAPAPKSVTYVAPLTPMQSRVLELVRERPMTQAELGERLGITQQGVSHHVKSLERAGHVAAVYDGRVWRYQVVTSFEIVP